MLEHHTMHRPTIGAAKRRQPSRKSLCKGGLLVDENDDEFKSNAQPPPQQPLPMTMFPPSPTKVSPQKSVTLMMKPKPNVTMQFSPEIIQPTKMIKVNKETNADFEEKQQERIPVAKEEEEDYDWFKNAELNKPQPPTTPHPSTVTMHGMKPPPPSGPNSIRIKSPPAIEQKPMNKPPPPSMPNPNKTTTTTVIFSSPGKAMPTVAIPAAQTLPTTEAKLKFKFKLEEQLQNNSNHSHPPLLLDPQNNSTINITFGAKRSAPATAAVPPPLPRKQEVKTSALPAAVITTAPLPKRNVPQAPPECPKWARVLGIPKNRAEVALEHKRVTRMCKLRGAPSNVVKFMLANIITWKEMQSTMEQDAQQQREIMLM